MKLELTINGAKAEIDLIAPAPDCRFRLDSAPERTAQVEIPEPNVYSILLDGRSYDAAVEETSEGLVVVVRGYRFEIQARDPRRYSRNAAARGADGLQTITAPMPGKVVRVLVAPGDQVESGQGLLVVEAMKMQNEMKAQKSGKVIAVAAKEGATVKAGELLATIE